MNKRQVQLRIRDACAVHGITNRKQIEYVLATVEHETADTFLPVVEAFWLSENWRKKHLRYYPYYGRGYVQITWKKNYEKFGDLLDIDLVGNPDLALEPGVAIDILVIGMRDGLFTGLSLDHFTHDNGFDFIHARQIINGMDKAMHIAQIAHHYDTIA